MDNKTILRFSFFEFLSQKTSPIIVYKHLIVPQSKVHTFVYLYIIAYTLDKQFANLWQDLLQHLHRNKTTDRQPEVHVGKASPCLYGSK